MCPHMEEHLSLGVKTQDDKNWAEMNWTLLFARMEHTVTRESLHVELIVAQNDYDNYRIILLRVHKKAMKYST
jgi:hypothetical protein